MLESLVVAMSVATWVAIVYAYLSMRLFRDTFQKGEPGRRVMEIVCRLFGLIALSTVISVARLTLNFANVQDKDELRLWLALIGSGYIAFILWWAIWRLKSIRKESSPRDATFELDPPPPPTHGQ